MANDHLTLDEIGVQHDDMMKAVIAKSFDREFDNAPEALRFMGACIKKALDNLKVVINGDMPPEIISSILKAKKVEIQEYKSGEHLGTYIYLDTELQYFISSLIVKSGTGVIIFHKPKYIVRTNVMT